MLRDVRPGSIDPERAAALFRLLGDPTRLRMLDELRRTDELCVHEIAEAVGTSETKVSQAMRLLRTADVVANRRDGRHVHYRLADDCVRALLDIADVHLVESARG